MLKLVVNFVLSNFELLDEVEVLLLCNANWMDSRQILEFDELHDKMMIAVKMVNNKVVGNFLIYIVLKCQSHRSNGLGFTAI